MAHKIFRVPLIIYYSLSIGNTQWLINWLLTDYPLITHDVINHSLISYFWRDTFSIVFPRLEWKIPAINIMNLPMALLTANQNVIILSNFPNNLKMCSCLEFHVKWGSEPDPVAPWRRHVKLPSLHQNQALFESKNIKQSQSSVCFIQLSQICTVSRTSTNWTSCWVGVHESTRNNINFRRILVNLLI